MNPSPPNNLPLESETCHFNREKGEAFSVSSFRWGKYIFSDNSLKKLKQLLIQEFGSPLKWTDDELRSMAYDLVYAFAIILEKTQKKKTFRLV